MTSTRVNPEFGLMLSSIHEPGGFSWGVSCGPQGVIPSPSPLKILTESPDQ
jgi:hypothetical protein